MLSYFNFFGGATPSVPQVSEFTAQNVPQNQEMESFDDLMLGELDFDYDDEFDFGMDDDEMTDMEV